MLNERQWELYMEIEKAKDIRQERILDTLIEIRDLLKGVGQPKEAPPTWHKYI